MTPLERKKLKHFAKSLQKNEEPLFQIQNWSDPDDSFNFSAILWLCFCWMGGLYLTIILTALYANFWILPFGMIAIYLVAQYHVVLEALRYPDSMIKEIKQFAILFVIAIILLIIIFATI